ncbi:hypothetical protein D6D17_03143 [Aureobasidium pullulans]|uniref:DNA repair protein Rad26 n=1 Tax=Aureobasidium pullulans TaxID=5580 RepID=A0A4V4J9Q5_AURPU|nr:hypothetical protein D6D18_02252 [Aureobasidium pullulans]THX14854.1 hypothetical protein D6D17_03143 [Aureobasidium pullulans]THX44848.1 hypothetical protein D6D10_00011 [Aureobasidium pullulans]THX71036.1 hypothetical protein D6D04_09681 [Aureobasidium pullulans]
MAWRHVNAPNLRSMDLRPPICDDETPWPSMNNSHMATLDDELDFDESGLEQLPQSTLQDLELNALSSTQREVAARRQAQYRQTIRPLKLTRPSLPPVATPAATTTDYDAPNSPESDYGLDDTIDDEEVLDLNADTTTYQPQLQQTYAQSRVNNSRYEPSVNDPIVLDDAPDIHDHVNHAHDHVQPTDTTAIDAHIRKLEAELNAVRLSLQNAKDQNQKQAGELSIIRARREKDAKEHEQQLQALNKTRADDAAKQKADLEAKKKEIEAYETNNRFLEHDLAQARDERSKRIKPTRTATGKLTRQPSQSLPYRDGFDDNEIVTLSPSKPKDRSKSSTPKVGEKRKRNAAVSPAPQLQLNPQPSVSSSPAALLPESTPVIEDVLRPQDDSQFQLIRHLMNHRPSKSRERVLETMSRLSFPSLPGQSISGLITEGLSQFVGVDENDDLSCFACSLLSDLWETCLRDKFYTPIYLILDLYEFILARSLGPPKFSLVERFLPLATRTIDLVAVPRVRLVSGAKVDSHLLECINVDQILVLMHGMAFDASLNVESCQAFWKKMEFEFTLMMLNQSQPLPQIVLVLQMLGSSVMAESFSIVLDDPEKQSTLEGHTIDRLTTLLFERPEAPPGESPYEDHEVATLQIETIRVLNGLATTKHGSEVLAQHRTAIGRLVRLLHVSVTKLYDLLPTKHGVLDEAAKGPEFSTIHELTSSLINLTVRLIYHLLTNYGDTINLREKLMVIPGGHHKFLVSLTRLAFSEQLVYEAGLDNEALDAAHEILDGILSPEEGEAVVQAIETPRGTTGTRVSTFG